MANTINLTAALFDGDCSVLKIIDHVASIEDALALGKANDDCVSVTVVNKAGESITWNWDEPTDEWVLSHQGHITKINLHNLVKNPESGKYYTLSFRKEATSRVHEIGSLDDKVHIIGNSLLRPVTAFEKLPFSVMMVTTTEGFADGGYKNLRTTDLQDAYIFLQRNSTTMGFTVQYGIVHDQKMVIEIIRKGKLTKQQIKKLQADLKIDEWVYSYSFAGKSFLIDGEVVPVSIVIDLTTGADVNEWLHALYGKTINPQAGPTIQVKDKERSEKFMKWLKGE